MCVCMCVQGRRGQGTRGGENEDKRGEGGGGKEFHEYICQNVHHPTPTTLLNCIYHGSLDYRPGVPGSSPTRATGIFSPRSLLSSAQ